jgi:integrase
MDDRVAQLNLRLKTARLGVQVERRGEKLNLRGTFPPRPGSLLLRSHQQRLSLGLPATTAGLKQAEQQAKIIAAQLLQKSFDWRNYLRVDGLGWLHELSLEQRIQAFEQEFFAQRQQKQPAFSPSGTKTTWDSAYMPYFRKLMAIAESHPRLTIVEAIYATVQATSVNSRSRQTCCTALNALSEFLNLELPTPLKSFWGNYSPSQTESRQLPTDELIIASLDNIPHPGWRFVYGIMAAYGLRNHEVFFTDYQQLLRGDREATVQVLGTTKTGSHEVWPFYPEWVQQFDLHQVCLPDVNIDLSRTTLQRIGQLVTRQFQRYQIPFSPYDLRHAWAVRTIHFGLPDTVAARMMGHSVTVHTRTYHRWITHRDQQQAVDAALQRSRLLQPQAIR